MKRGGAPRVVAVLAGLLERAAERGDAAAAEDGAPAPAQQQAFRGRAVPGIPVRRYAERIYRYAGCSPACFVVAYVYLDRLLLGQDGDAGSAGVVCVDSYTVHRLLITSVMVAAKFMDDRHHNNAYFARVGGVEASQMNALELRLLFELRFRLNVEPHTFARYCAALEAEMLLDAEGYSPSSAPPTPMQDDDEEEEVVVDDERHRDRRRRQALLVARAQDAAAASVQAAAGRSRVAVLLVADAR